MYATSLSVQCHGNRDHNPLQVPSPLAVSVTQMSRCSTTSVDLSLSSQGATNPLPCPSCTCSLSGGWKQLERFEREAKVLQGLEHPGIPRYLACFEQDTERDRAFFLVQVGRCCRAASRRGGPLCGFRRQDGVSLCEVYRAGTPSACHPWREAGAHSAGCTRLCMSLPTSPPLPTQEAVQGSSLAAMARSGWRPDEAEVERIATELLGTLRYLHSRRPPVVHRQGLCCLWVHSECNPTMAPACQVSHVS